ncbi:hypothetical protein [Nocardia vaccinii]|uniref:hypothetical protein n=1 Tax=Nocardia vaccinii TaxID=1822 RepID=UPI00082E548E|nr:hypothetical protein [Nocardia vaccinii]
MSDEQMGLDLGVEVTVDERARAWTDWIAPDRMESQIRKLVHDTLPDIEQDTPTAQWWDDDESLKRIGTAITERFIDKEDMVTSDNADVIDQLVRFVGEHFVHFSGAQWVNQAPHRNGEPIYDSIGPAVVFPHDEEIEFPAMVLVGWFMYEGWVDIWLAAQSYKSDVAEWKLHNK